MVTNEFNFSPDKFKCFLRYMIQVAKDKRCVPYYELENIFGLSHKQVGFYAGKLGDFCLDKTWPALNGLIISSSDCVPSEGFDWYQKKFKKSWGEIISDCWKKFHVTGTRKKQVQDFSGLDTETDYFLNK